MTSTTQAPNAIAGLQPPAWQWEIQPFDFEDFLLWAFRRGAAGRIDEVTWHKVISALDQPGAKGDFAAGMLDGVVEGARKRLEDEIEDTLALVTEAVNWLLEAYTVVYDPVIVRNLLRASLLAVEPADRSRALADLAAALHERHPATSGAIDALAEGIVTLEALAAWFGRREPLREVLGAIARESGDMLGDAWDEVVANIGLPRAQGKQAGRLVGIFAMEVALYLLGV